MFADSEFLQNILIGEGAVQSIEGFGSVYMKL